MIGYCLDGRIEALSERRNLLSAFLMEPEKTGIWIRYLDESCSQVGNTDPFTIESFKGFGVDPSIADVETKRRDRIHALLGVGIKSNPVSTWVKGPGKYARPVRPVVKYSLETR